MPLTIPNESAAPADAAQSTLYETDIKALVAGIGGDGVITGCAVTAQATPNTTVAVAAGVVKAGTTYAVVAAANVSMPSSDATNPRWVLVSASDTGALTATGGTAAAAPLLPAIPAGSVALAAVWWPANDTTVATEQITPKDVLVTAHAPPDARPKRVGATYYDVPGVGMTRWATNQYEGNRVHYFPMRVRGRSLTISEIRFRNTTTGTTVRVALYRASVDSQPLALVGGVTGVSVTTTGVKTAALAATCSPGNYLLALWPLANVTLGCRIASSEGAGGVRADLDEFDLVRTWKVFRDATANTTWADPGVAWDDADNSNEGFYMPLFVDIQ